MESRDVARCGDRLRRYRRRLRHRAANGRERLVPETTAPSADDKLRLACRVGLKVSVVDRSLEREIVLKVLLRVSLGEGRHGPVEGVARAEVAGDRHRIAGSGVGVGERPAAQAGVMGELRDRRVVATSDALPRS